MQKIGFKNFQNFSVKNNQANQNLEQKNKEKIRKMCITISSYAPAVPVFFAHNFFTNSFFKKMFNTAKSLSEDEIKILNNNADKILKREKLEKLIDIKNITSKTNLSKFLQTPLTIQDLQQVQQGSNAFFHADGSIYINREVAPNLLFHEIGHAHNNKFSSFFKKIFPLYLPSQKIPFVLAFASLLLNEEKPKEGEELTKFQKAKNVFRKTLPFLAAASSLPMLMEEGMATHKANIWARELLEPNLAKKLAKSYKFGFLTYLAIPISVFLISFLGMKYKDFLSSGKSNKMADTKNTSQ